MQMHIWNKISYLLTGIQLTEECLNRTIKVIENAIIDIEKLELIEYNYTMIELNKHIYYNILWIIDSAMPKKGKTSIKTTTSWFTHKLMYKIM